MPNDTIVKRQHFVPKFYLRNFLNGSNEVHLLDCRLKKILAPSGPKGICYEDFFYGLRTGIQDEVSQLIEDHFQKIEDNTAKNLNGVVKKILVGEEIYDSEKYLIATLMSMLWLRGPAMRKQMNKGSEDLMKQINSLRFSHPHARRIFDKFDQERGITTSPEMREKVTKTFIDKTYSIKMDNRIHLRMLSELEGFANLLFAKYWYVYVSTSDKAFITTDNPISEVIPKPTDPYGVGFFERDHYFPLTPQIFICATQPNSSRSKKFKRKILFKKDDDKIMRFNMLIANHAFSQAYATEKESLLDILAKTEKHSIFGIRGGT